MRKIQLFVTLCITAMGTIECLNVSSKIALAPEKPSLSRTSYAAKPDLIEFGDLNSGAETPSAPQHFNLVPMSDILPPQNLAKLATSHGDPESNGLALKCATLADSPTYKKQIRNCENGLCDFSSNTIRDSDGNLVTTIKFSIITNPESIKIADIPVIDGFRGIYPESPPSVNFPDSPNFLRNIPQIQKQVPSNFAPSFGPPKNHFLRPQTDAHYPNGFSRGTDVYHGQYPWMTGRDLIDDKISPPFSKTWSNADAQRR